MIVLIQITFSVVEIIITFVVLFTKMTLEMHIAQYDIIYIGSNRAEYVP